MIDSFKAHIKEAFFELQDSELLIATSGGIDSMVLSDLCLKAGLKIGIAHCNFNLRGIASDHDQTFVQAYAQANDLPFYTISFDTLSYKKQQGLSTQVAARQLRYHWFEKLIAETTFNYVLTAHHKDDNLETFFINLSRGSGIDGLCGIPSSRGIYRRPLLHYSRDEIKQYAVTHQIQWREDESNNDELYLRNYIRHQFIDEFSKLHPTAKDNLSNSIAYLNDSNELIKAYRHVLTAQLFTALDDTVIAIDIEQLIHLQPLEASVYCLFSTYGFTDSQAIVALAKSSSGKSLYSKTHRLLKDRTQLLLKLIEPTLAIESFKIDGIQPVTYPIQLSFEVIDSVVDLDNQSIIIDYDKLNFPLQLRKKQQGDRFYPTGLEGSKKLSKYFKDEKYDGFSKEQQWLLTDANNQIIWIIGKRMDRRFSVESTTIKLLKINYFSSTQNL